MTSQQEPIGATEIGPPPLRFEFVGMLFALAVAEVAVRWVQVAAKFAFSTAALPAHLHLSLAIFLISTSWLGWSWSRATGNIRPIEHPFSVEFLILLLDVALVVLYFMVASSVELIGPSYPLPSAKEELYLITAVFALYFFWDFLTKALFPGAPPEGKSRFFVFWERGRVSGACFFICLMASWLLEGTRTVSGVCMSDIGLISLVLLFRAWKRNLRVPIWVCSLVLLLSFTFARILG